MAMQKIFTWEILDSRDNPMVDVVLHMARGQIPSSCAQKSFHRGSHVGNKLATQEFIFLPVGASSFKEAMHIGTEVYHHLKAVIKAKNGKDATNLGNESSFALNILENSEALELLKTAIQEAGYPDKVVIGMDGTASEFCCNGKYDFDFK
ncbi:beta-enolase-like isoform 1 [Lynx pardinus]|uniref:phosphopyruvate hydratase n=1 Tax=Lynx pardinus TaxID=191816 RepID=A0A485PTK4_LYNPA|nr:beta-enolase-like isoform 1 [Lynx pardinus]